MEQGLVDLLSKFQEEARELGVPLSEHQINQFRIYLKELQEWNRFARLVSQDDPETIIWVHFLDSLSPYPYVKHLDSLLDIGTGAGFPGIPLKITLPRIQVHLMESNRRKVHFLKHIIRGLDLSATVLYERRLEHGDQLGPFPAIISRALASPQMWLPAALKLLEKNGQIFLMLGPSLDMPRLRKTIAALGLKLHDFKHLELPVVKHQRRILVLKK